ncbi:MAG: hypothetical protein JNK67_06040 [Alphaproteobacteria bacterium]|nr:hypothetical protein [Alphaproteobacteria bacterium]
MTTSSYETMVFLSYTLPETAIPNGYEPWLREVDNPFFNAIPGMGLYENWRNVVMRPESLPFQHFDFLHPQTDADLERVWFNKSLDEFRQGWIRKWGYGATGQQPTPASAFGWYAKREGGPAAARGPWCVIAGDAPASAGGERWRIVEALRKHYAIGFAPAGEAWRKPLAPGQGPGFTTFSVHYARDEAGAGAIADRLGTTPLVVASVMASPRPL